MSDNHEWEDLFARHLGGELDESEMERLAELLDSNPDARRELVESAEWETRFAEGLRDGDQGLDALSEHHAAIRRVGSTALFAKTMLAIAAAVIVVLSVSLFYRQRALEPQIAKITGLSGPLQFTGDGGRVFRDLVVGTELSGGTIDGLSPDSWFELEFNDGSTAVISGNSMLAFSDHGQKKLHLKAGNFSAAVQPQPAGKPMLIHTRSALLEVLGTRFEVEAGLSATVLNVSEGKVRVERLSDGRKLDVPAKHRVIAAADREMSLQQVPDSVDRWKSQLHRGPDWASGDWSPASSGQAAKLKTIPYITEQKKTIFTTALRVSRGDRPPVVLAPDSRLRIRGQIKSGHQVYFGMTLRQPDGDFAGRFQTIRPADEFPSGQEFEVVLNLREFQLDPSLYHMKSQLPSAPSGLNVESVWCHTLYDQVELAIIDVELLPPNATEAN